MADVSVLLDTIRASDPEAPGQLVPLVDDERRHLAGHRLNQEKPGRTLHTTALLHDACLRRVGEGGLHGNGPLLCRSGPGHPLLSLRQARAASLDVVPAGRPPLRPPVEALRCFHPNDKAFGNGPMAIAWPPLAPWEYGREAGP